MTIPTFVELLRPTRTKLRVLSLALAVFALYRLIELSPQYVMLLAAALIGFSLSPLSARRETVYEVEHVVERTRAQKPSVAPVRDETDVCETQITQLAKRLRANNKQVMSPQTAREIATRFVAQGLYDEMMSQNGEMLAA